MRTTRTLDDRAPTIHYTPGMLERIDHMVCVVPDLLSAGAAYERLGLSPTAESRHEVAGVANRAVFVGTDATNYTYLELLSVTDEVIARSTGRELYVEAVARGGSVVGVSFGSADIQTASRELGAAGCPAPIETLNRPDGSKVIDIATVDTRGAVPFRLSLAQYPETWAARYERSRAAGRFAHDFPLKRLDHLAVVAPDIEAATRFWGEVVGVPVHGEIRTDAMVIKQLKIGDAVLELLGPATPQSPMAARPAALASMAAWEVNGPLDAAVELARERGFTVSEPEYGVIPGTRRASIPAAELAGVGMQLLEYV